MVNPPLAVGDYVLYSVLYTSLGLVWQIDKLIIRKSDKKLFYRLQRVCTRTGDKAPRPQIGKTGTTVANGDHLEKLPAMELIALVHAGAL